MEPKTEASGQTRLKGLVDLEETITKVIGQIGLSKTNELLKSFIGNTSITSDEKQKVKLIIAYLVSQSISIFALDERQFYSSNIREYREARMACYFLLKKYTHQSYAKIGEHFDQKKRNVLYFCHKCKEILTVPRFHQSFYSKYDMLERSLIDFLSKLNYDPK